MKFITETDLQRIFMGQVSHNERITELDATEAIHDISVEIADADKNFQPGQSVGVVIQGPHAFGNPYHFRLYTVVDQQAEAGKTRIHLCVKRCHYIDEVNGQEYPGVASNYLCDSQPGQLLSLLGPFDRPFQIPDRTDAPIVMIGMGTGIAPFRAFLRRIYAEKGGWRGPVRLFYGARTGLEMLYMNDKKNDISQYFDEVTFQAIQAVSQKPFGLTQIPVADSLSASVKERAAEVWQMVTAANGHLFLAGLEIMQERLVETFAQMAGSSENWQNQKALMQRENRYQDIIY